MAGWVANRYPDPRPMQERVRAARSRGAVISGAASFGVIALLQLLQWGEPRRRPWPTGQPAWLNALAAVLLIAGAVIVGTVIVNAVRSERARANRRSPLQVLTTRQRRRVRRQALGQEPAPPTDVTFLRIVATRASKPDYVVALAIGAVPLLTGLAVLTVQPLRTVAALMAAFQVVASLILLRRPAHARAFLRDHPAPMDSGNR